MDAAHDIRSEDLGREVVSTVPPYAIVFAQEDQAIFALWYFRFALHQRPDIAVIAIDRMPFTWYQETLQASYPPIIFPKFVPWPIIHEEANPWSPVCFVQYIEQTKIQCPKKSIDNR